MTRSTKRFILSWNAFGDGHTDTGRDAACWVNIDFFLAKNSRRFLWIPNAGTPTADSWYHFARNSAHRSFVRVVSSRTFRVVCIRSQIPGSTKIEVGIRANKAFT